MPVSSSSSTLKSFLSDSTWTRLDWLFDLNPSLAIVSSVYPRWSMSFLRSRGLRTNLWLRASHGLGLSVGGGPDANGTTLASGAGGGVEPSAAPSLAGGFEFVGRHEASPSFFSASDLMRPYSC